MSTDPATKKEKILIISGDGSIDKRIGVALRAEGYAVFIVSSGIEGMKTIMDILPHLVILDLAVSGESAYDILEKKMAEPLLAKIPVFLLSTQGVPINMRLVPKNSVKEFVVSIDPEAIDVVRLVDREFHHAADIPPSIAKKKILWVEDDKLIGSILEKKLTSSGFDLILAKNGEEAFRQLATIVPNLIIMDLILPGISGFDIIQNIREDERLKKVPIMILSNLSNPSDIERAKLMGVVKFMVKAASSLDQIVAEVRSLAK
jgi:DNA-binding response OmpR family regulator